ncbi:MAG: efflux RND transporter permease subunit [Vulcanimicrobiaceae bacterium]
MVEFFLRRPIFASVCSLAILIAGIAVLPTLPVAQYPQIAPPVVTVTANYIGANPEAVETAVTTPLEEAINGVQGLHYISSTSAQGVSSITCTFYLGTNLDIAATDVQNAVQTAIGLLPNSVKQTGVTVTKNSGAFVMAAAITSNNPAYNQLFLSNYANLNIVNEIKRIPGVSNVRIFGERLYAMRIWLNPRQLAARGLTANDVVSSLQAQNVEVAAGSIGSAPEPKNQPYTISVRATGRLSDPQQFRRIILRANPDGGFTRLGDVARIQLGAQDYNSVLRFNGNPKTVGLGIQALPTANAIAVSADVQATLKQLAKNFPPGVTYRVAFDSAAFVKESIKEVVLTLIFSIVLVILVIYLFLQNLRATLLPAMTIPVSLLGAFFAIKLFGFTINTITLFGLTLATGLVVDDAIVVIENIARYIHEHKQGGIAGASAAMHEVQSAIIASSLVLLAVFVPVAFFPGTTGELYKQFALTIAASISISLFISLTLTPVLSARLLQTEVHSHFLFFRWFNTGLQRFRDWYHESLPKLFRRRRLVAGIFLAALALTGFMFVTTPTGFIPSEDQGFFIVLVQAPEGTSLANETRVATHVEKIIRVNKDVQALFDVGGFSFTGAAPNRGMMFVRLKPWSQRPGFKNSISYILYRLNTQFSRLPGVQVAAFNPPAINGVGSFGGFQFELEDRGNVGLPKLMGTAFAYMAAAQKDPQLQRVFTSFRINSPQLLLHVDRNKAEAIGVGLQALFNTLSIDLGSDYVNDFNYQHRAYRVYVQADMPFRDRISSLNDLYVRSSGGGLTPVASLVRAARVLAPVVITHYNLFRSIELNGQPGPGYGSGAAIAAMEGLAKKLDPPGVSYEWSGLSLDEITSGSQSVLIFALGLIFVFLVLSAQYESFTDPLIVLLAVPAALFGALVFMRVINVLPGYDVTQDAYAQVGYVMLIGLASKSAILIVEFANQQMRAGADIMTAALRGAQTRLRPILMTSIAFIVAVVPLVFAGGAGSAARHSLGTVVFGGMVVSTVLNLAITPVLYVIIKSLIRKRRSGHSPAPGPLADTTEGTTP